MNRKMKCIRLGIIIGLLFVSLLGLTVTVPEEADAVGPTVLAEVRWLPGQEVQEAEVKPGEHGTVTFNGVVNCELVAGGAFQKVIVTLTPSSEQSWAPTVNPPQITFSPNTDTDIPFSVTVTVPSETNFYITDTITISGRGVAYPGMFQDIIDPVPATIRIKQFYKFSLACSKPYQEVGPSEQLVYNLRIKNHGNARDTFHVSIKNLEKLAKQEFSITLSEYLIDIESKEEAVVQIPVQTPMKTNAWINEIETILIEVKSDQEERNTGFSIPREYPLTVRQRGASAPGFEPIFTIIAFAAIAVVLNTRRLKSVHRLRKRK